MKYVFGPVPSRRLGMSLGVDTIPLKTCNWNCVYCQLGRTVPLTNKRLEYFPRNEVRTEIERILEDQNRPIMDWITFVGSGEPTLHIGLGWLIQEVKSLTDIPIAVITNGSLLYLPEVRNEITHADAVLPTLDAGNPILYRKINRPHPEITFENLVNGLIAFGKEYHGRLWLEVMLVRGLNDSLKDLHEIALVIKSIQPDEVHINIPDRPPAEGWVQPADEEGLLRAQAVFGKMAKVVRPVVKGFNIDMYKNPTEALINVIARHPLREEDLAQELTQWSAKELSSALNSLVNSGKVQIIERYGCRFYSAKSARYQENKINHSLT